jgi:DNA-binding FrmR family transcriptional regulator
MTKYLGPMIAIAVMMTASGACAGTNCAEVIDDLKAMQKASQSISGSLISNHESFASILEEYADTLNTSAGLGQPVTKDAVHNMNDSAKAFRVRGQNAQKLNNKLNQASDQVIAKAIECIKSKK